MTKSKWITLRDGGSDQWLFMRKIGKRAYQFLDVLDIHAATGDDSGSRYAGELDLVDLEQLSYKSISDAQRSCGWDLDEHSLTTEQRERAIAEMCFDYGCKAPLGSCGGNNRNACEREMR